MASSLLGIGGLGVSSIGDLDASALGLYCDSGGIGDSLSILGFWLEELGALSWIAVDLRLDDDLTTDGHWCTLSKLGILSELKLKSIV